jgi:hypothetical protein
MKEKRKKREGKKVLSTVFSVLGHFPHALALSLTALGTYRCTH